MLPRASRVSTRALWVLPYLAIARDQPDFAEYFLRNTSLEELPHFAEHVEYHLADHPGDTSEFDFGLDLLLDGLERLRLLPTTSGAGSFRT